MATPVKVKKWGSSMAILIPRQFAKRRAIEIGTTIDLESMKVVKSKAKRIKLADLMAKFRPEHRHGEWNLGEPVGREVW